MQFKNLQFYSCCIFLALAFTGYSYAPRIPDSIGFNRPTRMQITSFGTLMIIHFHATFNIIHSFFQGFIKYLLFWILYSCHHNMLLITNSSSILTFTCTHSIFYAPRILDTIGFNQPTHANHVFWQLDHQVFPISTNILVPS